MRAPKDESTHQNAEGHFLGYGAGFFHSKPTPYPQSWPFLVGRQAQLKSIVVKITKKCLCMCVSPLSLSLSLEKMSLPTAIKCSHHSSHKWRFDRRRKKRRENFKLHAKKSYHVTVKCKEKKHGKRRNVPHLLSNVGCSRGKSLAPKTTYWAGTRSRSLCIFYSHFPATEALFCSVFI